MCYLRTTQGCLYLAGVIDLRTRKVIDCGSSQRIDAQLAYDALRAAIALRRTLSEVIIHTDRGSF